MRYSIPCIVHCDECDTQEQTIRQFAEFVVKVEARGAIQPIRGVAVKHQQQTAAITVMPPGWANPSADAPKVQAARQRVVSPFAPASEVAAATGVDQPAFLCPACATARGVPASDAGEPKMPEDRPDPEQAVMSDAPETVQ